MNEIINKIKNNFSIYWAAYFFLIFVAFNFIDNYIVFISLGIAANFVLFFFDKKKIDDKNLLWFFLSIIPLFGLGFFAMTSKFNMDYNANYSTARMIFLMIGLIYIPFLGFQVRMSDKFNIKKALMFIYLALGVWMLINYLITLFSFGPFYTFIYPNKYFFEYGHVGRIAIGETAYMLLGFSATRVTVSFFNIFACVLSSAILGVFFVSYKEDKRSFLMYAICGSIGLLSMILTLSKETAPADIVVLIGFALVVLFGKKIIKFNKPVKIVTYVIAGLAGLGFVLFFLNALGILHLDGNGALSVIFGENGFLGRYHDILAPINGDTKHLDGYDGFLVGEDALSFSGSWLFDMAGIAQLYGWLCFIAFVVILFIRYAIYYKTTKNPLIVKIMLMGFILGLLLCTLVSYRSIPYYETKEYLPVFFISPFIILLFIYGYMGKNEEEQKDEE